LGLGPLPPMIGATTKYWIFVQASNTINNIQNNNFRAVLPSGVEWNGRQSITIGSPLKFNPTNRQITWSFPDIPSFSQIGLYFEVSVTPNESQVNQTITLLKDIEFETYDKITGKKFLFSIPKINNIISPPDPAANKSANVVPVE